MKNFNYSFFKAIFLFGFILLLGFAGNAQKVYFMKIHGPMERSNLDGTNVETLISSGISDIRQMAIDTNNDKIYWTSESGQKISRSDLDGSNVEDIITGVSSMYGIDLDLVNNKIYYSSKSQHKIFRADLNGSNQEEIVTDAKGPFGIAVDPVNNVFYWLGQQNPSNNGVIKRAELDGSNVTTILANIQFCVEDIAIDKLNGKLYWTNVCEDRIRSCDLDGSNNTSVLTGQPNVLGLALDPAGGKMYFTDGSTIERADLDGSNAETLYDGGSGYRAIALGSLQVIPTMGEWALIIFALIMLSISTVYVMRWKGRFATVSGSISI